MSRRGIPRFPLAALALVAACRDPAAGPAKLSGWAERPVYRVLRADVAIDVDGSLDEPAWRRAFELPLVDSLSGAPARYPTVARLLWDDRYLYVSFEGKDDQVFARAGRRDGDDVWEDEVVELFVDAAGTGRGYVEIDVTPANVVFQARFDHWRSDLSAARTYRSGARTAARVVRDAQGDRGFTVEMAVPLESLSSARPRPGERWRANLYRIEGVNRLAVKEGQAFSPPYRADFHALDRFGWLVFDGGPAPPARPRR
ncbi:MAG TPA: carbohydrate-binding family 9-like protein [Anaeromyxobacteraceae bacterium]|nr:carbohydrate-binding family 9-like protein [Anaeromyxobacteraceae bacterium]